MKTMRQALAACDQEQLKHIGRMWSLEEDDPKRVGGTYQERLSHAMQDVSAARLLWDQLGADERTILYEVLVPSARYGIETIALQKKLQLPAERFDEALKRLLYALLVQTNTVASRANTASSSKKSKVVNPLLISAFSENVKTLYEVGNEFFTAEKDRSQMMLSQILSTVSDSDLLVTMQHYKLYTNYFRSRADDRLTLAERIVEREDPLEGLVGLNKKARETFKWLCDQGGKVKMQQVREYTGLQYGKLFTLLHTLTQFALAFDTFSQKEHVLFVPQEVYLNMKNAENIVLDEKKSELIALDTPPSVIRAEEPLILYDIMMMLNAVYQQNIEPTQQGRVPKRLATKLRPLLRGYPRKFEDDSDAYVDMILGTMVSGGIVTLTKPVTSYEKAHYAPGDARLEEWAGLGVEDQTNLLIANAWLLRPTMIDVIMVGEEDVRDELYNLKTRHGRTILLKYLSQCVPGRWYSVESLLDVIWDQSPFELRTIPPHTRLVDRRKGSALYKKWRSLDGSVFEGMIASSLYDMGMVELGYKQADAGSQGAYQRPDYFLLSEKGAKTIAWIKKEIAPQTGLTALYEGEDDTESASSNGYEVESKIKIKESEENDVYEDDEDFDEYDDEYEEGGGYNSPAIPQLSYEITSPQQETVSQRVLVVQPNYELLVMQPDFPTLYSLLPFVQAQQIGLVSRMTLTRASVLNGRKNGMSNEDIMRVLEEHSQKELPQNVLYTIQDWTKGYKSAEVSQALLLDVSSEEAAQSLLDSPAFVKFGLRRLGPTTLAVTKNMSVQDLKREFVNAGIVARLNSNITLVDPLSRGSVYGKPASYGPVSRRTTYGRY